MKTELSDKLIVALSSRTLFNLDDSHAVFETEGINAYRNYQIQHENEILTEGPAYPLVQKLLALKHPTTQAPLVEVILLSRNSADTGLRIFNSIQAHHLGISRAAFTNGHTPYPYVTAFGAHLFLSSHAQDVKKALDAHCAAATILSSHSTPDHTPELRIAFDGDAVLFSDESERIFQQHGLQAFVENEQHTAHDPLPAGPFKGFLEALQRLQSLFTPDHCPLRTALVTARNAPTHERVIRTLRLWNIRLDEALFLGGLPKGDFLKAFGADIFFDDQKGHCESTRQHVATGHVPHGIANETTD